MLLEDQLLLSANEASKSVAKLIGTGERYDEQEIQDLIYEDLLKFVIDEIGDEHSREACNYAELIGFSFLVGLFSFTQLSSEIHSRTVKEL